MENKVVAMEEFVHVAKTNFSDIDINYIFEVGSRDGNDAIFLKNHYPDAQVYAFEGYEPEYLLHKERVELSGVLWFNTVLTNYNGVTEFYPKAMGAGIHSIRDRGSVYGSDKVSVPCKRLDTFCQENNIPKIDLMKIDVEGCSYEVLQGLGNLISLVKLIHIETETVEYFSGQHLQDEVFDYLQTHGFTKVDISYTAGLEQFDSIWIK